MLFRSYPADARNRLASIATALMGLTRTDVAGDTVSDHETFGVVDPLDDAAALSTGRGTRVVMRGAREEPLADIIIGKPVANRPGFRYVRQPGQRQVYVSQVGDLVLSTSVNDWINPDLLGLMPDDVNAINLRNYALDRSTGRVEPGETVLLQKNLRSEEHTSELQSH